MGTASSSTFGATCLVYICCLFKFPYCEAKMILCRQNVANVSLLRRAYKLLEKFFYSIHHEWRNELEPSEILPQKWQCQGRQVDINFYLGMSSPINSLSDFPKDLVGSLFLNYLSFLNKDKNTLWAFLSHGCQLSPWRLQGPKVFKCFKWIVVIWSEKDSILGP